jgi:hypothetical protein
MKWAVDAKHDSPGGLGGAGESYNGWAQIGSGIARSNRAEFQIHCY